MVKTKKKTRASKRTVSLEKVGDRYRLRWTDETGRSCFNLLFPVTAENDGRAEKIRAVLQLDVAHKRVDLTFEKYKHYTEVVQRDLFAHQLPATTSQTFVVTQQFLDQTFTNWASYIRKAKDDNSDYPSTLRMMFTWCPFKIEDTPRLLGVEKCRTKTKSRKKLLSHSTHNHRLGVIRAYYSHLRKIQKIPFNPMEDVNPKTYEKGGQPKNEKRMPLPVDNLLNILEAIKTDAFCKHASAYKHSHYYPFFYFLVFTGVRPGEAIGLMVKSVNIRKRMITVENQSVATLKGTSHQFRKDKLPKNNRIRQFLVSDELIDVIASLLANRRPDDYVFTSHRGNVCDSRKLTVVLRAVLKGLGLPEKDLYFARHSAGTRAANNNIPLTEISAIMGNSPETVARHYLNNPGLPNAIIPMRDSTDISRPHTTNSGT